MGIVAAARLSDDLGIAKPAISPTIEQAFAVARLPVRIPADLGVDDLVSNMALDKKVMAGRTRLVLIRRIGEPEIVENVDSAALAKAIRAVQG